MIFFIGFVIDVFDGMLVRMIGKMSCFGVFLDFIFDRISDGVVFFGIVFGNFVDWCLIFLIFMGVYFVSYECCRVEFVGLGMFVVGIVERVERLLILMVFFFVGVEYVKWGVYIVGVFVWIMVF